MAGRARKKTTVGELSRPVQAVPAVPRLWMFLVVFALILATVAVYIRGIRNGYVDYDDNDYVLNNRNVTCGLTPQSVKWAFSGAFACNNWHPLTWLSHQLDITLFGFNAFPGVPQPGPHMVSLGLHIANTLLLLWFLYYTTRRFWPASLVAALFALHPVHVESVAWIAERKDVLSTFFWLATMIAYAWYVRRMTDPSRDWVGTLTRPWIWLPAYLLTVVLFALGLLAKPMLVTLPLVLLLLDFWPLNRFSNEARGSQEGTPLWVSIVMSLVDKLPLAIMAFASAYVTTIAQRSAMPAWELMDWPMRITNTAISYWRYILAMVWPVGLAPFYPHPHEAYWGKAIVGYIMLAIVSGAAVYLGIKRRYLVAGWLWYLGTLVPVIGLVQVGDQSHADRYTYVPLIGLFIMIAWGLADLCAERKHLVRPVTWVVLAVLAVFVALGIRQVGFWKDDITLFGRTVRVTEGNYVMLTNLGVAYSTKDELDMAEDSFRKSLEIRPNEAYTHNGLGVVYLKKRDSRRALDEFNKAIELKEGFKEAHMHAAKACMYLQRYAEAESHAAKVVELDPAWPDAHVQYAAALCETGQVDKAEKECRIAIQLNPRLAMCYFTLAGVYVKRDDFERAAEQYRKAISIEPDFSAWNNLGNSMMRLGRFKEAEESYRQSIKLNPKRADAFFNLGIVLAQQNRREEAIAAVRQALALAPQNAEVQKYLEALLSSQ